MANFTDLQAQVARLIAYLQRPEDPAIQAQIDAMAAQAKAAADAVTPPA